MHVLIATALAFLAAHQAVLIPFASLIVNDLINSSIKWSPLESTALGYLKQVVDRLSIHANSDSPGTLKWPLARSQPPKVIGSSVASSGVAGAVKTIAAISILAILPLTSCAAFEAVVQKTVACDAPSVESGIVPILGDVVSALLSGGANSALDAVAAEQGVDLVACAVEAAISQIENGSATQLASTRFRPATWSASPDANTIAISSGLAWLAVHTR
jgi:hypothetical protein